MVGGAPLSPQNQKQQGPRIIIPSPLGSPQRSQDQDMHEESRLLDAQPGTAQQQQLHPQSRLLGSQHGSPHQQQQNQQQHHQHQHRQHEHKHTQVGQQVHQIPLPLETPLPLFKQLYTDCVASFVDVTTDLLRPDHMSNLFETVRQLRIEHLGFHRPPVLRNGIAYMSIAETQHYSVGVFLLAPGATIPLHDHPNMCVVSNVLFGSVHCRSFDWMDPDADHADGGDCYEVHNASLCANDTRALYPHSGGNIHMFTAGGDYGCAILDVLGPPYDDHEGRPCDYYEVDMDETGNEKRVDGMDGATSGSGFRLIRTDANADFHVRNLPYRGPNFGGE